MNCEKYGPLLSAYIDNELNSKDKQKVNDHLLSCDYCQHTLEALKDVKKIISGIAGREPQPFFETRVLSRIPQRASLLEKINSFIAVEKKAIYLGIIILAVTIGLNRLILSPQNNHSELGLDEYLLENPYGKIITEVEISENDILSLAFSP